VHLAVVGKGGAGKSVIAGTLARVLARRGERVLAIDSDIMPGLAQSLGVEAPDDPPLREAAEQDENGRWQLRKGIGPVRAVQRYSTAAPDGVRLLQAGKLTPEGLAPTLRVARAFYPIVHRIRSEGALRDWTIVGDLPAGPRQVGFDWAPYADTFLVLVEPTTQSALTARRIARIARMRRDAAALYVANKVSRADDLVLIEERLGEQPVAAIPLDEAVALAERLGEALIDHAPTTPAVEAIERLVDDMRGGTLGGEMRRSA
jgi:CO dehydrogenase maturation factor